ncbi:MFS transporter [Actinomadura sp. 7K534]|uniref:MFS transporter n=1 Tax=Actinomadura sp. 7K534 TaxID=2530366 RepID=UPI0010469E17|nr:MFS transporter [Actinomadura sp. 7K534]TDB99155.1 MFS transporter [Actinomadura sp. 7K534]
MSTTERKSQPGPATRPRARDLVGYSAGSLGMGVWVTVPGLLLLYFMTHTLGVSPFLAGLTLLLPKALDAIVHPWFGSVSDRQARRDGHRRRMLRWGLLLAIAWIGLFSVPAGFSGWSAALWVGGFYILGNVLYACFQVPYLTTPSDLKIGYHERTRVFMYRMLLLTVGLLGAGVAAPALVASGGRDDYARMSVLLAGVLVLTGVVAIVFIRRLADHSGFRIPDGDHAHSVIDDLRITWRDRDFRALTLSYLFTGITTHIFLAAVPFYTEYTFDDERLTAVFMGAFLVPAAVAGPVWKKVSERAGKQRCLLFCQVVFVIGSLALWPGEAMGVLPTLAVIVVLGSAFAGLQLFAFSLIPDIVAAAEARGTARAGAYTGVWTATEATGTAIGPYVYSAVLAAGGFVATTEGRAVAQSDSAILALLIGVTVVPAALMAVAVAFQRRFALDRAPAR